jgi:hypothetical protein
MTRDAFTEYLEQVLHQAASGPPKNPRPEGQFLGTAKGLISGIRMVTPRGKVFYLAILQEDDMAGDPAPEEDGEAPTGDEPGDQPSPEQPSPEQPSREQPSGEQQKGGT